MNKIYSYYFADITINDNIKIQRRNVNDPNIKSKIISYDLTVKYVKTKTKQILTFKSRGERDRMLKAMIAQRTEKRILE